ncbi:hypothetical protein Halru_2225 [Halovivax ruber XH-70]|uniref:DUF7344 domain-containing protein n=1 Tax=Halovivax ruber (strain DSM 18193 / JCM 13892 / XH-70) TaxID=797302 RepID=L0IFT8_HALRX|nr:hypothetical protein [Halovivax ruber]AGB16812.1 hypothetical protein Halru_2225 [Halovivax ruber XH-70]
MTDNYSHNTDTTSSTAGDPHERTREPIPVDEVHRLLANERRRDALTYLVRRPAEAVPVEDVVDFVAEREEPKPGPGTARERIATDIHHVHVPKLADAEVVRFDPVAGTVRYVASERVEQFLSIDEGNGEQ